MEDNTSEVPYTGHYEGGTYEYYNIKNYDQCCQCPSFSDNWHEERFECLRGNEKCPLEE